MAEENDFKYERAPDPIMSERESMVRGFGQELSLGLSDEIEAVLKTMVKYAPSPMLSRGGKTTVGENYKEYVAATRELNKIAKRQNPEAYGRGEWGAIIGQFLPLLRVLKSVKGVANFFSAVGIANGAKEIAKTGKNIQKAVTKVSRKKVSTKEKRKLIEAAVEKEKKAGQKRMIDVMTTPEIKKNIAIGTGMGGIEGYGKSERTGGALAADTVMGGTIGAATSLALPVGAAALKSTKEAVKKGASWWAKLGEDVSDWIINNPKINLLKDTRDFKDIKKNFLKMATGLQRKSDEFRKAAQKKLRDDQIIPRSALTDPIDKSLKSLKDFAGDIEFGDDYDKAIKELEKIKESIQKGKLSGVDPDTNLITENHIWKVYNRLKKRAEVARDKTRTQDFAPILAQNLRRIRYEIRENLANYNPEWNKAFQPVREIEKLLGADEASEKGIRKVFKIKYNEADKVYKPQKDAGGVDMTDRNLQISFKAPFKKYELERQSDNRDLLNDLEDTYNKFVIGKKPALGPVKIETKGKITEKPTLLKEGETQAVIDQIEQMAPPTGMTVLDQKLGRGAAKEIGFGEDTADIAGSLYAQAKQKVGKQLAAGALSAGKKPLQAEVTEKTIKGAEALLDPTGVPRLVRDELIEEVIEPEETGQRSPALEYVLRKKREQAAPGEFFGIDRFRGYKPKSKQEEIIEEDQDDVIKINYDEEPPEVEPDKIRIKNKTGEIRMDNVEPENVKREKTAFNFLQQQRGLRKPKYS